jgi:hypothetical protein
VAASDFRSDLTGCGRQVRDAMGTGFENSAEPTYPKTEV